MLLNQELKKKTYEINSFPSVAPGHQLQAVKMFIIVL